MAKFVEVDVRGLSCPEPVLLTMDAMEEHPGEMIRVLGDEAHTRKNIEKMLEYEHKDGQTTTRADYEKLAETRCEIARLEEKTKSLEQDALHSSVTEEDLAHVIELWTGIPASRIQESELKKLADLEGKLNSKVIGQKEAVEAVAAAIRRSKVQICTGA